MKVQIVKVHKLFKHPRVVQKDRWDGKTTGQGANITISYKSCTKFLFFTLILYCEFKHSMFLYIIEFLNGQFHSGYSNELFRFKRILQF